MQAAGSDRSAGATVCAHLYYRTLQSRSRRAILSGKLFLKSMRATWAMGWRRGAALCLDARSLAQSLFALCQDRVRPASPRKHRRF